MTSYRFFKMAAAALQIYFRFQIYSRNLFANQISARHLNPRLIYYYFCFRKTTVLHSEIQFPVFDFGPIALSSIRLCISIPNVIQFKLDHPWQSYDVTSNVTSVIEVRSACARLFAGTWRPLVSVITTLYYVAIIFHRRVWHCALSLRYGCIRRSGIILIP